MSEKISVCVKFRPLLVDWEDYECWIIDPKKSRVFCQKNLFKDIRNKRLADTHDAFTYGNNFQALTNYTDRYDS